MKNFFLLLKIFNLNSLIFVGNKTLSASIHPNVEIYEIKNKLWSVKPVPNTFKILKYPCFHFNDFIEEEVYLGE